MDRSNMQQSYVRQSYIMQNGNNNVNRSFISTALVNESLSYGDDLRRSRIQNLPNYKKTNLGESTSFVIVFQTIQIQRLSNEVEVLRVKLKQYERQIFNAQNYEVQIRQLTQKCFAYERERQEYREELDKLNKICQTLYHQNQMLKNKLKDNDFTLKQKYQSERSKNQQLSQQIQKWKARHQAGEKSKAKQLQDLRNLMQCQRKSMIDRQIRQMTIRFQTERSNLQNEIRKAREIVENRNRDIEDYKQKCQRYEIHLMQLKNYQNVIADNQNKIIILNQELIRLNEVLRNKEDEFQTLKQKEYKLNQMIKQQKEWEYENKQLRSNLQNNNKEINQWKVKVSRLQDDSIRGKQLQHYNEQLGNKLGLASRQLDRLNNLLKGKLDEIEQWKKRMTEKEIEVSKYKNLQNDVARFQSKFDMIQTENDRINGILKTRLTQIEDWKAKYMRLESSINNYTSIEKDKKSLQQKFNKQIKYSEELQFQLAKAQKDLNNLRNFENMAKDYERKNMALGKQIDRLNGVVRNSSQQLQDFRTRYSKVQSTLSEYKAIESRSRDYENKIILLTQQIQRLNTLIRNKNQDIQQLQRQKLQIHQKMSHYKNYQVKASEYEYNINKLDEQAKALKKDIENWQGRFKESDLRSRELQNHLFLNTQQKQKLSTIIKNKNNQYQNLRSKYANLEDNLKKISQLEMVCQEQHNRIVGYNSDLQKFQKMNKEMEIELESERTNTNQFAYKIIVLSVQIERLTREGGGGKNSKEMVQLQENYSKLQSKNQSKNNQIEVLMNRISSLQSQVSNLKGEFNRLLREVDKSQKDNLLLIQKIDEYQDYAKRIHILGAEIDRLQLQNKSLDEDARRMRLKYSDNIAIEKQEQSYNFNKVLMAIEIESLRNRLNQREINMQEMRKSILQPVRRIN